MRPGLPLGRDRSPLRRNSAHNTAAQGQPLNEDNYSKDKCHDYLFQFCTDKRPQISHPYHPADNPVQTRFQNVINCRMLFKKVGMPSAQQGWDLTTCADDNRHVAWCRAITTAVALLQNIEPRYLVLVGGAICTLHPLNLTSMSKAFTRSTAYSSGWRCMLGSAAPQGPAVTIFRYIRP